MFKKLNLSIIFKNSNEFQVYYIIGSVKNQNTTVSITKYQTIEISIVKYQSIATSIARCQSIAIIITKH